ncbi:alpha/beta hydrolase [Demequina sp. SYSU T00192]|uniref:Alpha/beta hydrolase n=1 Tax=Demequina litoralis TaxID=3051660 RepID=A0ABT8GCT4_9MICO|nr:alpha/beta hydrolase [Demequina sp. SYSU T00192]MDN4476957.1 alpha/beta hydrolase [Demequina sp. SYSU T00192]
MTRDGELERPDGRTVRWYTDGPDDADLVLFWHHGTPNIGQPPGPLMKPATDRGIRWVSIDRPGYGGSTRREGRCVADVVEDVAAVADELGIESFAVVGHSGGGPHALACAALIPSRVRACVSIAGLAPFEAGGLDWYGGMANGGRLELEAAALGPAALRAQVAAEWDPESFTPEDNAALAGEWGWFTGIVKAALELGPDGMVDDDLAYVRQWGFAVEGAGAVPLLIAHGGRDRVVPYTHGEWLVGAIPGAEQRFFPEEGHISVLLHAETLLDWLVTSVEKRP